MGRKHCKCLSRHSDHGHGGTFYVCNACGREHREGAPDSPTAVLANLVNEAIQYPIHLRIAAKLHLDGVLSEDIAVHYLRSIVNEPMLLSVVNALRDLENELVDHEAYHRKGVRSLSKVSENI